MKPQAYQTADQRDENLQGFKAVFTHLQLISSPPRALTQTYLLFLKITSKFEILNLCDEKQEEIIAANVFFFLSKGIKKQQEA